MRVGFVVTMLLMPTVSMAADISIGGVSLKIPSPAGFTPVTPEMSEMWELYALSSFAPTSTGEKLVVFIPEGDPTVLSGLFPDSTRCFSVSVNKELIGVSVTTSDFAKLKNLPHEDLMKEVATEIPDAMKEVSDGLARKYGVDLGLSVSQFVWFPVHEITDRTVAYSCRVKSSANNVVGNPTSGVSVVTVTFLHVKSKLLVLFSRAEEDGLEWSRNVSRQWASAVLLANPSDAQSSLKESPPSPVPGIDWGRVGAGGLGAAIIYLLISLSIHFIGCAGKRGKSS